MSVLIGELYTTHILFLTRLIATACSLFTVLYNTIKDSTRLSISGSATVYFACTLLPILLRTYYKSYQRIEYYLHKCLLPLQKLTRLGYGPADKGGIWVYEDIITLQLNSLVQDVSDKYWYICTIPDLLCFPNVVLTNSL